MHSNATYCGRANILKRPNRLNARSGSAADPPRYQGAWQMADLGAIHAFEGTETMQML